MNSKKIIAVIVSICIVVCTIATNPYTASAAVAKKITFNTKSLSLQVGDTSILTATITPDSGKEKVKWTSSNKKIVIVSSGGKIKAMAGGVAFIKAALSNGKSASCKVAVKEKKVIVKSITLNRTKAKITLDDTLTLTATVLPVNAVNGDISWSSSDEDVAFVDDEGTVIPVEEGTAIITAEADNGVKKSCVVTVIAEKAAEVSVTLDRTSLSLSEGEETQLTANVTPDEQADELSWDSSNEAVVMVDEDGNLTAIAKGTATITVSLDNGSQATCAVIVKESDPSATPTEQPDAEVTSTPTTTPEASVTPKPTAVPTATATPTPTVIPTPQPTPVLAANSNRISLVSQYYTLALKDNTNLVMDVYGAGQKNGTAVQVYSSNQTTAQKWQVENHDDGTISLIAGCATTKVLDIMRTNNSTTGALKAGCKVDIYDHNDYPAQHFYVEQFGDGSCVLRLASNTNIVVQASSASQEATLVAGNYDANNSLQRWYITPVNAVSAVTAEKDAYVYNTGGQGVFVRNAASASAGKVGGFAEGQKITVIGDISNGWYKVRGTDRNNGSTIEGYSSRDYITFTVERTYLTDDYPYSEKSRDLVDPWNFYYRECTSFVAWRLNNNNKVAFTNQYKGVRAWGNATTWGTVARSVGITVDKNPAVGSVAWWDSGHVAWVAAVNGDNVTIEDYNSKWDGTYGSRIIKASTVTGYIHIKDLQ